MGLGQPDAPPASARNACRLTNSARRASVSLAAFTSPMAATSLRCNASNRHLRALQLFRAPFLLTAGSRPGQPRYRSHIPAPPNAYAAAGTDVRRPLRVMRPESGAPDSCELFALAGVTLGATFVRNKDRPPFVSYLVAYPSRATVLETRWPRCVSVACWRIHPPPLGRRAGLGATPLRSDDLRPGNPALVTPVVSGSGSLPARACGAIHPCGKAICPPPGGWRRGPVTSPAAGRSSMRTKASS